MSLLKCKEGEWKVVWKISSDVKLPEPSTEADPPPPLLLYSLNIVLLLHHIYLTDLDTVTFSDFNLLHPSCPVKNIYFWKYEGIYICNVSFMCWESSPIS